MNNIEANKGGQKYVCPSIEIMKIDMEDGLCQASQPGTLNNGIYCDDFEDGDEF